MPEIENENLESVQTEEQADALLDGVERPDTGPIQDAKPAPQATPEEWELTVGGKAIKAKRDQIMKWAQMGYDAPNKIRTLSQELEGFKKKWSDTEPLLKNYKEKYDPIDEYVRQNPQFWDHVLQSYQNRNQALSDTSNPLASMVQQLQTQVQGLVQYKDQIEQQQSQARMQHEDQAYTQTLDEMKKSYPDIDFDTPDEEGKTLEYKVLEHAQKEGIKNFKTAFRDFYHDELMKRGESKAKESILKDKQKNTKLGILGISATPTKRQDTRGVRQKSYDDLASEALAELGIR